MWLPGEGEAAMWALSTVPFSNNFKILNRFNLQRFKAYLPLLEKFQIKYGRVGN
jgi:hypothetical protein